ncbi:RNA polymerase sigma factor [Streptomyces sp. NPDC050485]|uniref:RNA polymerase sigma factor n=1 Tax=Streptomyces sp. NPDC050485 TaxID=3365617 RepID=UPI003793344D
MTSPAQALTCAKETDAVADTATLVRRCLEGAQPAWRALVERYSPLVWKIARSHRLGNQDCEEVYQLTWLRAYQHLAKVREPHRFADWLTTCARRESLKQLAREGRYLPIGDSAKFERQSTEPGDAPDHHVLRHERRAEVHTALRRLPSRDQALLALISADPAPGYDEISRTLGVARGSVGPLRGRALRRLAEELASLRAARPGGEE